MPANKSKSTQDAAFLSVWQEALVRRAKEISLDTKTYPVRRTAKRALVQVDCEVDRTSYRSPQPRYAPLQPTRRKSLASIRATFLSFFSAQRLAARFSASSARFFQLLPTFE